MPEKRTRESFDFMTVDVHSENIMKRCVENKKTNMACVCEENETNKIVVENDYFMSWLLNKVESMFKK